VVEYVPLRHYILRHNKAIFWTLQDMIPEWLANHVLFRLLLGWMVPPSVALLKYTTFPEFRNLTFCKQVFQDIVLPMTELETALDYADELFGVMPVLIYPCRVFDYGAKGNGELLLYFGFVLPDNPADTVQIPASLIQGHEAEPGSKRQFFRVYADPGGAGDRVCLPPEMLDAARAKCPGGEAELPGPTRDAIAAVYGASAVAEEPDWTSIEAYLNDPAETDGMVGEIGTPLSCANESAALEVVRAAVQSCLDEVEGHLSESAYQTEKYEMVRVYRQGQLRLFYGCLQAVDRLKRLLQSSS